jgi:hypothetical protein
MYLSSELYRKLSQPPAHVLKVESSVGFVVSSHATPIHHGGVVLSLQHTETNHRWQQLFVMDLPAMQQLAECLASFITIWEESHGSQRGDA